MSRRPHEGKSLSFPQGVPKKITDLLDVGSRIADRLLKIAIRLCKTALIVAFTVTVIKIDLALSATIIRKIQADGVPFWESFVGIFLALTSCALLMYKVPKVLEHWCERRRTTTKQ